MSQLTISGPVAMRGPMVLEKACDANVGHEHNYDHVTLVISGRVRVLYRYVVDGREVEGQTEEFGPGEPIEVRAKVRHTITALAPNTVYVCIFSHRDFGGIVVERYEAAMGNEAAYI